MSGGNMARKIKFTTTPLRTHTHKHTLFRFCEIHPPFSSPDCINISQAYPLLTRKEWKKRRRHGRGRRRRCGAHEITVLLEFYVHQSFVLFASKKRVRWWAVFYNAVLIPKSKNMAKIMADFSDYPVILFAMFRRGSISDPSGVDMAPCRSVAILLNREAGVFFSRKSTIRPTSRISLQPLQW
jgi:hypothetical protein